MQLKDYTGKEINDLLDSGSLSILDALGASDLKKEMKNNSIPVRTVG